MTLTQPVPVHIGARPIRTPPENSTSLTRRDFASDQEVRWCPGCGDYAILAALQGVLADLGLRTENVVCVSGIGCSSRMPYYLNTYGMHSIHGRAPAIATGLATTREDLSVWVVTGDGDALSIGGNHLIHALRRNVNITILLFNNQVYGLTKGQYSPTSGQGTVTKSSPAGSVDHPFNPVSLALGAEATFVARTADSDRTHLTDVLRAAAQHRGASLVEIYQNCPVFNDGAFNLLKSDQDRADKVIQLQHGAAVEVGSPTNRLTLIRSNQGELTFVPAGEAHGANVVIHDSSATDPSVAFSLSRLGAPDGDYVPMGIFRDVDRPTYDDQVRNQIYQAVTAEGAVDLQALIRGRDTWQRSESPTNQ